MSIVANALARFRPEAATTQIGPIGIDFSLESVHLVQLESIAGGAPQVRARTSLSFDCTRREFLAHPHQFRSLIRRALESQRFYGRKAVLAMPSGMFRTVSINYQFSGADENEGAVVLRAMKDRVEGDLSDYVLDYMPVKSRSKNDERLALVAVSEKQRVLEFLDTARRAKLDVEALEIGPVAISRLVSALSAERGVRNILVINTGRRASYLTLISGSDLLFDQEVALGEDSLIHQVSETLDMPQQMARDLVLQTGIYPESHSDSQIVDDDNGLVMTMSEILKPQFLKLVEEVKRAFMYAAAETRGGGVSQVYLLGGIARWPGSDRLLGHLAGVEVQKIPDPLALFTSTDEQQVSTESSPVPQIAVATGLALRGMQYG